MPIRTRRRRRCMLVAAALVAALVACDGDDVAVPDPTTVTTTTTPAVPRVDDGRLVIGALFPVGDTLIGPSIDAAAEHAVDAINAAGGVLGRPIRLVVADEGTSATTAATGIDALLDQDVDAIVGPSSSVIALASLDGILDTGVLACSPSASALRLDDFPDESGLFFRTIASDSFQAVAIADVVEETGAREAAIVHVDDPYGRSFADSTAEALDDRDVEVTDTIAVSPTDEDVSDEAATLVETGTRTVVVLGTGPDTGRFLDALSRADVSSLRTIVVNDAARDAAARPVIAALDDRLRSRVTGVAPQVLLPEEIAATLGETAAEAATDSETPAATATTTTGPGDGEDVNPFAGPFAAQVIDCINLIALAATQAQSDSPVEISRQMSSVSAGGSICRTFADCVEDLEQGLLIDYNGPSGVTELGRNGDPTRAWFEVFGFDDEGRDDTLDTIQVSR